MTAEELRKKYLEFFKSKKHAIIPSASLMPENDPSVLFTTAGMHPLVPFLMGEKHPLGKRLTDVQKCIRTSDIDEVGDATHHTFFEMLGNWSLGDYFKKEAIEMSWEFLTSPEWLGLDKNRIAVSVFAGDEDAPFDQEAFNTWKNLGIPEKRIAKLPKKNNWWGMETGPCGPDSEMFYWVGDPDKVPASFNDDNILWVEIWNDVFLQYNKTKDGKYESLKQQNVDTGMGLERTLAVLNGFDDNYLTEVFLPIIQKIEELSGKKYQDNKKAFRIIADHIKAATMILGDEKGIVPSNVLQGYVLRRLIRRAVRYGKMLGINNIFTFKLAEVVIEMNKNVYPEVKKNKDFILQQLINEEEKFAKALEDGLVKAKKIIETKKSIPNDKFNIIMQTPNKGEILGRALKDIRENIDSKAYLDFKIPLTQDEIKNATITGEEAFYMYQTFGFPRDMMIELAQAKNLIVDTVGFREETQKHQELSRTASAGMFKGGLADASEETKKLHTAAHLMLAALRKVLGDHVMQKGANITPERLRFDFSHGEKMTPEQIKKVEDLVNEQIQKGIEVKMEEVSLEDAKNQGAMGIFDSKYGDKVKVYTIDTFSKEICGGPHASNTSELGHFKIQKEESSSAGVRRIKAVLE